MQKTKRIQTGILITAIILGIFVIIPPVPASAATHNVSDSASLATAFADSSKEVVINMTNNITHSSTLLLAYIERDVTLNLNSRTLDLNVPVVSGNNDAALKIGNAISLTVNGPGTFNITGGSATSKGNGIYIISGASLKITNEAVVNVESRGTDINDHGVYVFGWGEATVTTATALAGSGVRAFADPDCISSVTVTGNVTGAQGVSAFSNSKVTIGGNVTATDNAGWGVTARTGAIININGDVTGRRGGINAEEGSSVTVGGNVTSTGTAGYAHAAFASNGAAINIAGNAASTGTAGNAHAAYAYNGGQINVGGNVTASGYRGYGAIASNAESSVTVGGNAEAKGEEGYGAYATGTGSTVSVKGNAKAMINGTGALAISGGIVTVGGNAEGGIAGADATNPGSVVNVTGDAVNTNDYEVAVWAEMGGTVNVGRNAIAQGENSAAAVAWDKGSVITIGGNAESTGSGENTVGVHLYDGGKIYINGTISGAVTDIALGWSKDNDDYTYTSSVDNPMKTEVTLDAPHDGYYWDEWNNERNLGEDEEFASYVYKRQGAIEVEQPPAVPGNGTDNGTGNGTDNGTGTGTGNGTGNDTGNGTDTGTGTGTGNGTDTGTDNGTGTGNGTTAPDATPAELRESFAIRLYEIVLGRPPEAHEVEMWVERLQSGNYTGSEAAFGFFFGVEYLSKEISNEQYIEHLYLVMLGRDYKDDPWSEIWIKQLDDGMSRDSALERFLESEEYAKLCDASGIKVGDAKAQPDEAVLSFIWRMYNLVLGRKVDQSELIDWHGRLTGKSVRGSALAQDFFFGPEYTGRNRTDEEFVDDLYAAIMGRNAKIEDAESRAVQIARLQATGNDKYSRRDMFDDFTKGPAGTVGEEWGGICDYYGIEP